MPSSKWFPTSFADQVVWFSNFATQMATVGTSLGFTAADVTAMATDADQMSFMQTAMMHADTYSDALRHYRNLMTQAPIGSPPPALPTFADPGAATAALVGIFDRLDRTVKKIRAANAYTSEIGALLGIIPSKEEDLVETEMKPILKASAMPGSVVEVTFKRGHSDGILIETKIDNAADWSSAGNYFKSPASLNIPDGTGLPHSVQVRARYIIGNEPVGLNSDTVNVVTTP